MQGFTIAERGSAYRQSTAVALWSHIGGHMELQSTQRSRTAYFGPCAAPHKLQARQRRTEAARRNAYNRQSLGRHPCKRKLQIASRDAPSDVGTVLEEADEKPGEISEEFAKSIQQESESAPASASEQRANDITLGTLFRFALPTLAIWLIGPSLSLVDTAVVGTKSSTQLAALGPGCILCDLNGYFFTFLAVATTNLMAVSIANRNQRQAREVLSDAIGIALVLGVLFGVGTYFACPTILQSMTGAASAQVIEPASLYVKIRCFGAPAAFVMFVTNAFFLAAWDPLTPLRSALLAGGINLILDLFLVNVMHWGIAGAAAATAFSQIVVAGLLIRAVSKPLPKWSPINDWRLKLQWRFPTVKVFARFLIFAGPICFVLLTKVVMYNCLGSYASSLGAVQSAGNHMTMVIFGFFAVFGDVVSQAAQTFLPGSIGSPKSAQGLAKKLFTAGAGIGALNSTVAAGIVLFLPWLFTSSPEVTVLAAKLSPLLAAALCIHTASLATEGMLLAGRDLSFLVVSYVANMALTLGSLSFVKQSNLGVMGSFLCLCQFQVVRLIVNGVQLTKGKNSPLNREQPLQSWITDDVKAAVA